MLVDFFIKTNISLMKFFAGILPDIDKHPLPDGVLDTGVTIFSYLKLIFELPIIRVFYHYLSWYVPIFILLLLIQGALNVAGFVRGSNALDI